jgi:hypothetical protein
VEKTGTDLLIANEPKINLSRFFPSVKALCHFPGILALMSERIGETTDLGNAFLAQEAQVMDGGGVQGRT